MACGVDPPSDEEGFCNIYSPLKAQCTPIEKGHPLPDQKKDRDVAKMLGYACMGPEFNAKIQLYIEELKIKCGDPCK